MAEIKHRCVALLYFMPTADRQRTTDLYMQNTIDCGRSTKVQKAQECDATMPDRNSAAGLQNIYLFAQATLCLLNAFLIV